jgi:hypothetical protein
MSLNPSSGSLNVACAGFDFHHGRGGQLLHELSVGAELDDHQFRAGDDLPIRKSEASEPPDKNVSPWRMTLLPSVVVFTGAIALA